MSPHVNENKGVAEMAPSILYSYSIKAFSESHNLTSIIKQTKCKTDIRCIWWRSYECTAVKDYYKKQLRKKVRVLTAGERGQAAANLVSNLLDFRHHFQFVFANKHSCAKSLVLLPVGVWRAAGVRKLSSRKCEEWKTGRLPPIW